MPLATATNQYTFTFTYADIKDGRRQMGWVDLFQAFV